MDGEQREQQWSRRLCKKLTQPQGVSNGYWIGVPVVSADGNASEWIVHIDQSTGDDSLDPPPYTWQWAIYDGNAGQVLWSTNSTLAVSDLWHLYSTPTLAAFAILCAAAADEVLRVSIYAVDTHTAAVRFVRDASGDYVDNTTAQWQMQQAGQTILYQEQDCQLKRTACMWRAVDALSGMELWRHDDDPLLNGLGWAAQWQHLNYSFLSQEVPRTRFTQFSVAELGDDSHRLLLNVASATAQSTPRSSPSSSSERRHGARPARPQQMRNNNQLVSPLDCSVACSAAMDTSAQPEQQCACFLLQVIDYEVRTGKPSAVSPLIGPIVLAGTDSTDSFYPTIHVTLNDQLVVTALGWHWVFDSGSLSLRASNNRTERLEHLFDRFILLASPDRPGHSDGYVVAASTARGGSSVTVVAQPQS